MRQKFEKLPEIAAHIHNVIFDIGCDEYLPKKMGYVIHEFSAYFLNGAWYAFQEQQKKIDGALKELELLNYYRTGNSDNAIKILKGTDK